MDYLFFRIYWWNKKIVKDQLPLFSAILGTSILIGLNLITIFEFVHFVILNSNNRSPKLLFFLIGILAFLFCYFYFLPTKRSEKILTRYAIARSNTFKLKDIFLLAYIITTFTTTILMLNYIRQK